MHGHPSDTVSNLYRQPFLYDTLANTSDQAVIGQVIAEEGDDRRGYKIFDDFRVFLAQRNPHLTEANFKELAADENYLVRGAVARRKSVPLDVLERLLADEHEDVRVSALWNRQTSMEVFTEAVFRGKFSSSAKKGFCHNGKAVRSFEVFNFLWSSVRSSHVRLVDNLNYAVREKGEVIDPKILKVVHEEIRYGNVSDALKESYAGAAIALPELLDDWKDDSSRAVINAIAKNDAAWVSTHEYLVDNYRSGHVRMFVAMTTDDCDLLNKIHQGTKSRATLDWVEKNPAFVNFSKGRG